MPALILTKFNKNSKIILDYSTTLGTLIFLTSLISVLYPRSYYMSWFYLRKHVVLKDTNLPHLVTGHLSHSPFLVLEMDCYHHAFSKELYNVNFGSKFSPSSPCCI